MFLEKNIEKANELTLAYPFLNIKEILEDFLSKKTV